MTISIEVLNDLRLDIADSLGSSHTGYQALVIMDKLIAEILDDLETIRQKQTPREYQKHKYDCRSAKCQGCF